MINVPSKPSTIGDILENAYYLCKEVFKPLLPVTAAYGFVVAMLQHFYRMGDLIYTLIFSGVISFVGFTVYTVLFYLINSYLASEKIDISVAIREVRDHLAQILLAAFLVMIVTSLASLLFVLPGIFAMVLLFFTAAVLILEKKTAWQSMSYSAQLVWGNWWRVFGIVIALIFVAGIINLVAMMIAAFLPNFITLLLMLAASIINIAYSASVLILSYRDLKIRAALSEPEPAQS